MTSYELWQHTTSGAVYVVAAERCGLIAAAGPLQHHEHAAALLGHWGDWPDVLDAVRQAATTEYRLLEWSQ